MRAHWKYIVVSLLIGGFLGAACSLCWVKHMRPSGWGRPNERMRERFYKQLALTPEQRTHVDAIMQDSREKMKELRKNTHAQIRQKLNPEQQTRYDAVMARRQARWKRWESDKR